MKIYKVGGAVRDRLLGLPVKDTDWLVTGASEQQMLAAGFKRADADADFPVFLHPDSGEEHALARREAKAGSGYRGFRVEAGPDVTLEEDLKRRDLTINAIAEADDGTLIDPFDGQRDLREGWLRHVTPAFVEDPLRVLRIARFAARLGEHGFRIAHPTWRLIKSMVASGELKALTPERVWRETRRAMADGQPWRYIETLHRSGALRQLMPELDAVLANDAAHADGPDSAPIAALKRIVKAGGSVPLRIAVLLVAVSRDPSEIARLCRHWRMDKASCEAWRLLAGAVAGFEELDSADAQAVLKFFDRLGGFRGNQRMDAVFAGLAALYPERKADIQGLQRRHALAAAVNGAEFAAAGLRGDAIATAIREARLRAIQRADA